MNNVWVYNAVYDNEEEVLNEWYENIQTGECISVDEYNHLMKGE